LKKIILIFPVCLVFCLAILNYRCNGSSGETAAKDEMNRQMENSRDDFHSNDNWNAFRDRLEEYRLYYPGDWTLSDHSDSRGLIRADIGIGNTTGLQIRVIKDIDQDFKTFTGTYLDNFMADMKGHWQGEFQVVEKDFGMIGKHHAFWASLIFSRGDGQEWFFKEYLWERGLDVVAIQAGTPSDMRDDYEPVLDEIAESFRFED